MVQFIIIGFQPSSFCPLLEDYARLMIVTYILFLSERTLYRSYQKENLFPFSAGHRKSCNHFTGRVSG